MIKIVEQQQIGTKFPIFWKNKTKANKIIISTMFVRYVFLFDLIFFDGIGAIEPEIAPKNEPIKFEIPCKNKTFFSIPLIFKVFREDRVWLINTSEIKKPNNIK